MQIQATKSSKFIWHQFETAHCVIRVRETLSKLSNALETFQQDVSLFLLIDLTQQSMNVVSFSTYIIVKGLKIDHSDDFVLIFIDAFVRTVILTFACGQPALEVRKLFQVKFHLL